MDIDTQLKALRRATRRVLAKIAALLLEAKRTRYHAERGFATVVDYAAATVDLSARKAREVIELAERSESLPAIRAEFETGRTFWTKLRTIARVATPETEGEWLDRARTLTSRALELQAAKASGGEAPKIRVMLELTGEQYADLEDAVRMLRRERQEGISREQAIVDLVKRGAASVANPEAGTAPFRTVIFRCDSCAHASRESRLGAEPVARTTAARACCDSEVVDARRPRRLSRTIPRKTRRFVLARDRFRCIVRGCSGRDFVEVHHIVPREHGGGHEAENLATLCPRHHADVHEGRIRISPGAHVSSAPPDTLSEMSRRVLTMVAADPAAIDDLIEQTARSAQAISVAVAELELAGLAYRRGGVLYAA